MGSGGGNKDGLERGMVFDGILGVLIGVPIADRVGKNIFGVDFKFRETVL